ncbi:hypothetical protein CEXT_312291 [Caerostris extrusa]|uniref:Uncharacterized protein n=1 Tax=Caerostris extrusa TaxID=172846 RepID=A0AAV4UWJ0_CAEEX|nr:hypothetical protein CEXT_312291 [Caerostris extrusa]
MTTFTSVDLLMCGHTARAFSAKPGAELSQASFSILTSCCNQLLGCWSFLSQAADSQLFVCSCYSSSVVLFTPARFFRATVRTDIYTYFSYSEVLIF